MGAGMLLGGFAVGILSLVWWRSSADLERAVRDGGYAGGAAGLALLVIDNIG